MKQLLTLLFLAFALGIFAQAPQIIPYQAVVRNTDGSVMASASITMTLKIHDVSATGTVVYEETHSATSNTQGLVSLNVGAGTPVTGTFGGVNWGSGSKFLHVLMNTGSGNVDLGTQQMMSVPYALYAEKAGETSTSTSLQIGQSHAGGKIFYIDESGKHGLVYAVMNTYPQYSRSPQFNIYGDNIGSGEINNRAYLSEAIPRNILYNDHNNDAVMYCDTLNHNGFSDWFLPSSYELYELIYRNVEFFQSAFYISSTDGIKPLTPNSTYGDGGIIVQPVLVQRTVYQSASGSWDQVNFSLGYCFNYWGNCALENYFVIPIRKF